MTGRRIEYFGLCGAGKSTFHKLVSPRLAALPVAELIPRAPSGISALANAAIFSARLIPRGIPFLTSKENWWLALKIGYRLAQFRMLPLQAGKTSVMVDTGIFQPMISYAAEHQVEPRTVPVETIASALPLPASVIYIKAPPAVAFERYCARSGSNGRTQRHFERAEMICEDIALFCRKAGVRVLTVGADETLSESVADRVVAELKPVIAQP